MKARRTISTSEAERYRLQASAIRRSVALVANEAPAADLGPALLDACQAALLRASELDRLAYVTEKVSGP